MPDDRFLHKSAGHSRKVNALNSDEFRTWVQYKLSADDFGVMLFSPRPLRADNDFLDEKPAKTVMRWLERVRDIGLLVTFEHQDQTYCCQWDWQRWQKVEYPRPTVHPKPDPDTLAKCDDATRLLFSIHPGGQRAPSLKPRKGERELSPKDPESVSDLAGAHAQMAQAKATAAGSLYFSEGRNSFPRARGLMAGSSPVEHGECLAHGPVCFRPFIAKKYLPRFGGDQPRMVAWAKAVCEREVDRIERGGQVAEGDDFAYWAARYDEDHKHTSHPRTAGNLGAAERFAAKGER